MKRLPFKVSAKTARLFGRENVSNAEGAIAELVKNTYDADACICLVCFMPRFSDPPSVISKAEFEWALSEDEITREFYTLIKNKYTLTKKLDEGESVRVNDLLSKFVDLWIIDNGDGMGAQTIEDNWMVIGTNYKEKNIYSPNGRARTGAKGIGRFALDRLGNSCDLYSSSRPEEGGEVESISWSVDWSLFDSADKILDQVTAELHKNGDPLSNVVELFDKLPIVNTSLQKNFKGTIDWSTGTAIRIGLLRDRWTKVDVNHLFKSLGALIPPTKQKELNLFLFDAEEPELYGYVSPTILDDYDYRLDAKVTKSGYINFSIFRNELIHSNLDKDLFDLDEMREPPFNKASFGKKKVTYKKNMTELFPGAPEDFLKSVKELGEFEINLLFFKKGAPSKKDLKIYPYRGFQPGPRKAWLEEFGGIKIYRDNFAVRPYGELGGRSFDWLTLGQRVATSPVAASRKGWKVSPQNIAGTISISRLRNAKLNDQSNREGIIENKSFSHFREIILRAIREFEDDRSHIHYNLNDLYKQKNQTERAKSKGAETANKVISSPENATSEDAQALALGFQAQEEEIKELKDEQTMLRSLATLGTVLVSFSHEMGQLQNTMGSRAAELADILNSYVSHDDLMGVGGAFNPYTILDDWEKDDRKVKQWFTFALSSIRADKRRRKWVALRPHLSKTKTNWLGFLAPRQIDLDIKFDEKDFNPKVLAFEIDLDSIFNNLILNSVEVFLSSRHKGQRKISIDLSQEGDYVFIEYKDNGPGLDSSIKNPMDIFDFAVTTKRDSSGKTTGTGLGLWILAAVVETYGGVVKVFNAKRQNGFRIQVHLPIKLEENDD